MLRGARRDWIRLHRAVSAPWLRQTIEASLVQCAPDDETCRVDVVVATPDLTVSLDILESWVVERALALGLWSIARLPMREVTSEGGPLLARAGWYRLHAATWRSGPA